MYIALLRELFDSSGGGFCGIFVGGFAVVSGDRDSSIVA